MRQTRAWFVSVHTATQGSFATTLFGQQLNLAELARKRLEQQQQQQNT